MTRRILSIKAGGVGNHLFELRDRRWGLSLVRVSLIDARFNAEYSETSGVGAAFSWITFFLLMKRK
jgi:hypothetical protein